MKNGVIIINKEEGLTSQGVVNRVKRMLSADKAGHTGTLDPMATGFEKSGYGAVIASLEYGKLSALAGSFLLGCFQIGV